MKRLANLKRNNTNPKTAITRPSNPVKQEESVDMILNRLVSGSGLKIKRKIM